MTNSALIFIKFCDSIRLILQIKFQISVFHLTLPKAVFRDNKFSKFPNIGSGNAQFFPSSADILVSLWDAFSPFLLFQISIALQVTKKVINGPCISTLLYLVSCCLAVLATVPPSVFSLATTLRTECPKRLNWISI